MLGTYWVYFKSAERFSLTKSDFILKVSLLIKTCKFCSFHERHKKANIIVCMVKQFCWQWCVRKHT